MGAGIVIWDEEGEVLVSLWMPKGNVCSPIVAEVHALWRAVELCTELRFTNVVFEGDALTIIDAINRSKESWVWYGQMIEDLKQFFTYTNRWKLQHVYREGNQVAHSLAKNAIDLGEEIVWIENYPDDVFSVLQFDRNVILDYS
ncbi:hypothetical protein F2P56_035519 [Juglans regia]|uniref:Uncharacterized protein LOC109005520 n=2 Tax=Juglans regia TaxID=51240 RepID=A0A2I4G811_JUGRE|nr:uncharacterized protein LOC109005520 [Juglans regia]KAF5442911.1 hypothetical protein F2P56_035519 [Juglans regia]